MLSACGSGGGGAVGLWPGGGGGGGGGAVGFWPGGGGGGGVLSASGPGGGGVPSGKEGRGGALYYVNGFTTAPGICPCVCEFSLTRLLIISRLFWRPLNPAPGDIYPPPLATPLLVAAVMSIQTTLFGGVLKDVQHIYKVPRDAYEKFIEYDVKGGGGGGG